MSKMDQIIAEGNRRIDTAVERVIFKHTYLLAAMAMAESLNNKSTSRNDVPVTRIHLSALEARATVELLAVAAGYFQAAPIIDRN